VNPVLHAGAETAQLGWVLGCTTAVFLASMVGWTWWAFAPSRSQQFVRAGRIPLDGGDQ
jgi:cbb3-type cytochrome oxidase subunit 3